MMLYVFMATNASYYVFDVLTVDDANTLTIIGLCKYFSLLVITLQHFVSHEYEL